jgi:hypothetical protein
VLSEGFDPQASLAAPLRLSVARRLAAVAEAGASGLEQARRRFGRRYCTPSLIWNAAMIFSSPDAIRGSIT